LPREVMRKRRGFKKHPTFGVLFLRSAREVRARDEGALAVNDNTLRVHVEPRVRRECAHVVVYARARVTERPHLLHDRANRLVSVYRRTGQRFSRLLDMDEETNVDTAITHGDPQGLQKRAAFREVVAREDNLPSSSLEERTKDDGSVARG